MLSRLKKLFNKHFGPGSFAYGILRPCRRCVYQRLHEPILIFSKERGPRVIIVPLEGCYVRIGKCIGFRECGKCFEAIKDDSKYPCKWVKI